MNKTVSASILMLLLSLSFATIFSTRQAQATTTNTIFTTQSQVYSAFDSLVNNSTIWKQTFGVSDKGNTIYAYWIRTNQSVACDINHDGRIGLQDLLPMTLAYGSSPNNTLKARWNPSADIDDNGIVGLSDLVTLALNYERHGTSLPSKIVMLDGSMHGYEYESSTLLYNLALFLSNSSNPRTSNITNSIQFFIVPIVNYDEFGPNGQRLDANGVNINRNFAYGWSDFNWNYNNSQYGDPQGNYRGPSPASENETQELQQVFNKAGIGVYNNLHVGGSGPPNNNPNGTWMTATWDYENNNDLNKGENLYNNYTAVSTAYNMTNVYRQWDNENVNGSSASDAGYSTHIPSVTLETFYYDSPMQHPSADQLNGTMLDELKCLVEGDKNFLTGQGAYAQQGLIKPMDDSGPRVYVDPSITYTSQYCTINVNVTISNVTDLAGWQLALTWSSSKLNCTNATIYDPSTWNGSLSCNQQLNNSYTSTTGYFFNAQAMEDGDTFNGTVTVATLTFYVLGFNTNTTLTLNDVGMVNSLDNLIATSTTNGSVHIDNQQ